MTSPTGSSEELQSSPSLSSATLSSTPFSALNTSDKPSPSSSSSPSSSPSSPSSPSTSSSSSSPSGAASLTVTITLYRKLPGFLTGMIGKGLFLGPQLFTQWKSCSTLLSTNMQWSETSPFLSFLSTSRNLSL